MRWLNEQRRLYHALGPARYWTIMVGTVVFCIGFGTLVWWLSDKIGWPDAYGFQCRGKGCLFVELWHSPSLLQGRVPSHGVTASALGPAAKGAKRPELQAPTVAWLFA